MNSMSHTALESYAYHNALVKKYFSRTTNSSRTYLRTYSDVSNPDSVAM